MDIEEEAQEEEVAEVEESSLLDDLAEDVTDEGSPLFDEGEETTESPTESPSEEETEEEVKEETPVPFHQNPRWKKMREENKELKSQLESQTQRFEEVDQRFDEISTQSTDQVVPLEYQKAFGNNFESYSAWLEITTAQAERIVREEMTRKQQELADEQTAQAKQHDDFIEWAEADLADLSSEIGIDLTNPSSEQRNQILKICEDYGITGPDGQPDFRKANELRKTLYVETPGGASEERKSVASKASKASNATTAKAKGPMTRKSLRQIGGMADYLKQNS